MKNNNGSCKIVLNGKEEIFIFEVFYGGSRELKLPDFITKLFVNFVLNAEEREKYYRVEVSEFFFLLYRFVWLREIALKWISKSSMIGKHIAFDKVTITKSSTIIIL